MEKKPWNSWTQISLAMTVVFACAGIWWLVSEGMNAVSMAMFVLALHSLLVTLMYYKWPQFADNVSNMTQFVNHSRLTLIWIGFLVSDTFRETLNSDIIYKVLVIVAIVAFGYMSIRSLMAFLRDIR